MAWHMTSSAAAVSDHAGGKQLLRGSAASSLWQWLRQHHGYVAAFTDVTLRNLLRLFIVRNNRACAACRGAPHGWRRNGRKVATYKPASVVASQRRKLANAGHQWQSIGVKTTTAIILVSAWQALRRR